MIQKIILPFLLLGLCFNLEAQTDTTADLTKKDTIVIKAKNDTVQIGSMLIVTKKESETPNFKTFIKVGATLDKSNSDVNTWLEGDFKKTKIKLAKGPKKLKNIETNWWTLDIGFANFNDYSPKNVAGTQVTAENLSLNNGKSRNVNLWAVQQKLNIYQHKFNLKYGVGLEMFNFRFDKSISFREDIPQYIKYDDIPFTKNKLLVKYLTIPVQINFKPNPNIKRGFYASVGLSAGYLLNAKNKQISAERGKEKFEGSFNLNDWRVATIGELGIGSIRLYGSYGMNNLFNDNQKNYKIQPFSVGLRFSNF